MLGMLPLFDLQVPNLVQEFIEFFAHRTVPRSYHNSIRMDLFSRMNSPEVEQHADFYLGQPPGPL
jgi:hypothetical protein